MELGQLFAGSLLAPFWQRFQRLLKRTSDANMLEYLQLLKPTQLDAFFLYSDLTELHDRSHPARKLVDSRLASRREFLGRPEPIEDRCLFCGDCCNKKKPEEVALWHQRHCRSKHFRCRCCKEDKALCFGDYSDYLKHIETKHRGCALE